MPTPKDDPLLPLWELASKGDQDAITELVKRIRPWTLKKAQEYEVKFKNAIPADDYISAANYKLPVIIESFDPAKCKFMSYYMACSARAMMEAASKTLRNRELLDKRNELTPPVESYTESNGEEDETVVLARAMTWLTPIERSIMRAMSGEYGKAKTVKNLAAFLKVNDEQAEALYDNLRNRLQRHMATGLGRGRQRCPVTKACIEVAMRRRSQGRAWKEIVREIHITYGRKYTVETLKEMTNRRRRLLTG